MAASDAQRAKIVGSACVVCLQTKGLTPAHLAPRSLGGCDHPDCVVPLCWMHHRAYDTGRLELLPHLEPRWRAEVAHAVLHLGARRRVPTAQRTQLIARRITPARGIAEPGRPLAAYRCVRAKAA